MPGLMGLSLFDEVARLPGPAGLMQHVFGEGYDPVTGRVDMERFSEWVRDETQRFSQVFSERLTVLGADPALPVAMALEPDGMITIQDDHPQHGSISGLFATDPHLCEEYARVAHAHYNLALQTVSMRYIED
ncbi:MAG: hypothetical protein K2Q10_01940, partial [Rhodospirillales bacterium]|nr:hypothetical protein [Rhodospirillales bacterium]